MKLPQFTAASYDGTILLDFVLHILTFFGIIYDADERPEARSMTLGCAAVMLLILVGIGVTVWLSR